MTLLEMVAQSLKAADGGETVVFSPVTLFYSPILLTQSGGKVESQRQHSKGLWGWNLDSPRKCRPRSGLLSSQQACVVCPGAPVSQGATSLSLLRAPWTRELRFQVTSHQ